MSSIVYDASQGCCALCLPCGLLTKQTALLLLPLWRKRYGQADVHGGEMRVKL